jgi:hypothetical protein
MTRVHYTTVWDDDVGVLTTGNASLDLQSGAIAVTIESVQVYL